MKELLLFAVEAARAAGQSTLQYFRTANLEVERKGDGSPVTKADKLAEEVLRGRLRSACPDDAILGEEFGEETGTSGRTWIIDPVDGTRSFARGVPLFGTLLALEEEGCAVLGIIYMPALEEMVFAARGDGAWWNVRGETRRARVSSTPRLADGLLCTTSVSDDRLWRKLRARMGRDRGWGDCYGHLLVATGRADVMYDARLAVWDSAALLPCVEEAGGAFFDLAGAATHRGGSGISTNAALADAVRAML